MDSFFNDSVLSLVDAILQFSFYAAIVIGVIAYFAKEYAIVKVIKNVFSVLFLIAGVGNVIYFTVSIFLVEFRLYNLTTGIVLYVIGSVLKRWKLPTNSET